MPLPENENEWKKFLSESPSSTMAASGQTGVSARRMANLDLGNPESSKQKASSSIRKGFDDFIFLALDHISKKESTDRAIAYKALQNEVKNAKSFSDPAQFEELEGKLMKAHADYGHDKTTQAGLDLLDDALQRTEDTFTLNTEL